MMAALSRDSLDQDTNTLIFEPHRGTVRIHGVGVSRLLNRCGVHRRQWDHLRRCWMVPLREMPGLIALATEDRRNVLIDDHAELDAPREANA
ncbi:MAG: hypothetical protein JWO67_46 [Streptosporangiaceae bacterium]|nr:hypothetical protein [Streptosporangiaceae bacterium]